MLYWSAVFFVISIVAAMLGFTTIAGSALDIANPSSTVWSRFWGFLDGRVF